MGRFSKSGCVSARALAPVGALATALLFSANQAIAQSHEQIIEQCRESVGRPIVQACMAGKRGDSSALEACRSQASPKVRACVIATEQKIAAKKAAPAAPVEAAPQGDISSVQTAFVAPPRSIADITAVLDQEKPDAAKIAKAQADAETQPSPALAGESLVQFYYDRAAARASLARNADALA
ncbi:MAG: hypothetical protein JOZ70_06310, partial [Pseudolabrys sp.]|nr:hypothetical protein [Pseudolabrys sp.]